MVATAGKDMYIEIHHRITDGGAAKDDGRAALERVRRRRRKSGELARLIQEGLGMLEQRGWASSERTCRF